MEFIFFELFVVIVGETGLGRISISLLLRRQSAALEFQPYSAGLKNLKKG